MINKKQNRRERTTAERVGLQWRELAYLGEGRNRFVAQLAGYIGKRPVACIAWRSYGNKPGGRYLVTLNRRAGGEYVTLDAATQAVAETLLREAYDLKFLFEGMAAMMQRWRFANERKAEQITDALLAFFYEAGEVAEVGAIVDGIVGFCLGAAVEKERSQRKLEARDVVANGGEHFEEFNRRWCCRLHNEQPLVVLRWKRTEQGWRLGPVEDRTTLPWVEGSVGTRTLTREETFELLGE